MPRLGVHVVPLALVFVLCAPAPGQPEDGFEPPFDPETDNTPAPQDEPSPDAPDEPSLPIFTPGNRAFSGLDREQVSRDTGVKFSVRGFGEYTLEEDLDNIDGGVSVTRAGVELDLTAPLETFWLLNISFQGEYSQYEFDFDVGTEPWEDVSIYDLNVGVTWIVNREWSAFGGFLMEVAGEDGADFQDTMTFGGLAGARYRHDENLALTFGIIGKTRLEERDLVLPILGLDWQFDEHWKLLIDGPALKLQTKLGRLEAWTLTFGGEWQLRDFRLDDNNPILPEGIGRDTRVPVYAQLEWEPTENILLGVRAGVVAYQEFDFEDSSGNEVSDDNTDPAPFFGFWGQIDF